MTETHRLRKDTPCVVSFDYVKKHNTIHYKTATKSGKLSNKSFHCISHAREYGFEHAHSFIFLFKCVLTKKENKPVRMRHRTGVYKVSNLERIEPLVTYVVPPNSREVIIKGLDENGRTVTETGHVALTQRLTE